MVENLVAANDEIPSWNDLDDHRQGLFLEALQRGGYNLADLGISGGAETETPPSQ